MFTRRKVAAVNFVPWKWHKAWNADKVESLFVTAARSGAKLAVAPEAILEGYVANEAVHFPELREAMVEIAEPIDGPQVRRFRKLARQLKIALVLGMAERRGRRDVYNTALFIGASGALHGVYSKMQFGEGYDASWHFNRLGKQVRAFDTPFGRCGLLICNDRGNPLLVRALAMDGARFLCIPTYGSKTRAQDLGLLARARETGVPIVQANVGKNLVISRGEVVARDRRSDAVTLAEIDIPAPCGPRTARALERQFLAERPAMMKERLVKARKKSATYRRQHPHRGRPPKPRKKALVVRDHTRGPLSP